MTELSQAAVERIMKNAGAGRISSDATESLTGANGRVWDLHHPGSKKDVRSCRKEDTAGI